MCITSGFIADWCFLLSECVWKRIRTHSLLSRHSIFFFLFLLNNSFFAVTWQGLLNSPRGLSPGAALH